MTIVTNAWTLIVWTIAMDGLPTTPIKIVPGLSFDACRKQAYLEERRPATQAVCRPMVFQKA